MSLLLLRPLAIVLMKSIRIGSVIDNVRLRWHLSPIPFGCCVQDRSTLAFTMTITSSPNANDEMSTVARKTGPRGESPTELKLAGDTPNLESIQYLPWMLALCPLSSSIHDCCEVCDMQSAPVTLLQFPKYKLVSSNSKVRPTILLQHKNGLAF
jgi:hypothetical protein